MSYTLNKLPLEIYKNTFNELIVGIVILSKDSSIYFVNDKFCSMLGYSSNELIGKSLNSISYSVDIEFSIENIFKFLRPKSGSSNIEKQFVHKNGNVRWVQLNFSSINSDNGEVEYIIVSINDTTEQKRVERELLFSEEKNKTFSEATNEAIFFSDKGVCIDCNSYATQMFGYTYDEFIGMFAADIIAPESKELVKQKIMSGYVGVYEVFAQRKDGSIFCAEIQGRMSLYKGNEIRVSTFRNISDLKNLEFEQKASELSYKLLFENMNEAFALHKIIVNEKGEPIDYTYLDVNPVYEKLTGINCSEVIGKNVLEVLPHLEKYWIEIFGNVALTGESTQYTNFVAELNRYYETRVYSPEKGYFAVAFTDVTEKRNTENEVALQNKRLESLVRLSQINVSNYIELIHNTIAEATSMVNGSCGAFYFYNSLEDKYELRNCVLNLEENSIDTIKMEGLFQQVLALKTSMLFSEFELLNYVGSDTIPIKSMICIPAKSNGTATLVFGIGSKNIIFTEVEKRHLTLFIDSALLIIEKQRYQDQILTEKIKAEINESRFFEIQKAGKIGWYEALLDKGLFLGSYETYTIFFDENYDYPVSADNLMEALHPDDREYFFNVVKNNVELKSPEFEWEYRVITPKSGIKYVFSKAFLQFDEHGKLIRRYGIVQDITEKKKNELELLLHNERLESLFRIAQITETSAAELLKKALNEAIKLTSSDIGFIFRFNKDREFLNLESYSEENLSKEKIYAFREVAMRTKMKFLASLLNVEKAYIDNDLLENRQVINEVFGNQANYKNVMLVPISRSEIESIWIIVINKAHKFNDTDAKQVALLMDSVWKVIERQKYQEELIKAKEKAEESDKLKSAFLANMSHEIRTPMNGIIGFSDLLVQENTSVDKRQSYAKIVIECGKQLLTIVDDILDISKIEVGQVVISLEPVSVNDVVTSMFSFYSPKSKDSNISLFPYKDLSDELSIISTDKQRLVQVLNNLLSNAFKFTLYGEISFGYYLKNGMLEFYVKDTGTGIPENMQAIVFERFRQAEQSNIRNFRGTGLGLSISQKLIELLGGNIWLESEVGKGSTFYFTLPYKRVHVDSEPLITPKINAIEPQLTILIAEDEEINLLYVNEVLLKPGVKLLHAKNGLEAVDLCKKHVEIDLVLMDIKMPEMDGLLATSTIRKFRFDLPIIAVTAFAMESDKEQAFLAGCSDYISKPIHKTQLLELVNKYINMPN